MLTCRGLVAVITAYASVMAAIKLFGVGYLLWLAFMAVRSAVRSKDARVVTSNKLMISGGYFRCGLIVQMSNPKAALS